MDRRGSGPIEWDVTLKHDFNSLPKEEKLVLLFKEKGYILSDKELEISEKNESHRAPCFLKSRIFFVSNSYWPIYIQLANFSCYPNLFLHISIQNHWVLFQYDHPHLKKSIDSLYRRYMSDIITIISIRREFNVMIVIWFTWNI